MESNAPCGTSPKSLDNSPPAIASLPLSVPSSSPTSELHVYGSTRQASISPSKSSVADARDSGHMSDASEATVFIGFTSPGPAELSDLLTRTLVGRLDSADEPASNTGQRARQLAEEEEKRCREIAGDYFKETGIDLLEPTLEAVTHFQRSIDANLFFVDEDAARGDFWQRRLIWKQRCRRAFYRVYYRLLGVPDCEAMLENALRGLDAVDAAELKREEASPFKQYDREVSWTFDFDNKHHWTFQDEEFGQWLLELDGTSSDTSPAMEPWGEWMEHLTAVPGLEYPPETDSLLFAGFEDPEDLAFVLLIRTLVPHAEGVPTGSRLE